MADARSTCLALDIGGVFHGDSWETIFATELAALHGVDMDTVRRWGAEIWDAHAYGPSSEAAYWQDWSERLGRPVDLAQIQRLIARDVWVDRSVVEVMDRCDAAGMDVRIVSNNTDFWYRQEMARAGLGNRLPTIETYLSCDTGFPKDHPSGGLALLARSREPGGILFVDDRAENVAAALELGMRAIRYEREPGRSLAAWLLPLLDG